MLIKELLKLNEANGSSKELEAKDHANDDLQYLTNEDFIKAIRNQKKLFAGTPENAYFQGKDLAGLDKLSDKELDDKFVQAECLGEFTRPKVRDGSEYFNIGQRKFWEYDVILRGPDKSSMMHKAWAGTAKDGKTVVITIDPHGKKYTD